MKELQAVNQQVILDFSEKKEEQRTAAGIIIPDTAKEKPRMAPVGSMAAIENAEIKPGDVVIFKQYSGTELKFEDKDYLIIPYADILAKVVETEPI